MRRGGKTLISYYDLGENLKNTKNLTVKIEKDNGESIVNLSRKTIFRLEQFLRDDNCLSWSDRDFDCASFAHHLNDIDYIFSNLDYSKWVISSFEGSELNPGDTIMTSNELGTITHFAIYLDDGIYLSKYGNHNKLIANTLEEIKKSYKSEFVHKLKPVK
jgi:hypothetical protein